MKRPSMTFSILALTALWLFAPVPSHAQTVGSPGSPTTGTIPAQPMPSASPGVYLIDIEAGGYQDQLSNSRGSWNDNYLLAIVRDPKSSFSVYALGSQDSRFGFRDHRFEFGVSAPTDGPHGTLSVYGAYSPEHNVLAQNEFGVGYDLRAGGGYGYQVALADRAYPSVNALIYTVGADRYFGNNRVAYVLSIAQLNNVPGVALSHTLRYSHYAAKDTINLGVTVGQDVENTGTRIAVYATPSVDLDVLHWTDPTTGVHIGLGFYNVAGAYGRFEVRLGLRKRI